MFFFFFCDKGQVYWESEMKNTLWTSYSHVQELDKNPLLINFPFTTLDTEKTLSSAGISEVVATDMAPVTFLPTPAAYSYPHSAVEHPFLQSHSKSCRKWINFRQINTFIQATMHFQKQGQWLNTAAERLNGQEWGLQVPAYASKAINQVDSQTFF